MAETASREAQTVSIELTKEQFFLAIALLSETDEFVQGHIDIPKVEDMLHGKGWYEEGELPHDLTEKRREILQEHRIRYFSQYESEPHWQDLDEASFVRLNEINDGENLHRSPLDERLQAMMLVDEGSDGLMRLNPEFGLYLDLLELLESPSDDE